MRLPVLSYWSRVRLGHLYFPKQVYIYESPTQVRILTRADELYGEPVLPHFRLPLATLFEDIEAAEPPQQTTS